jgi:hypothetical protein
MHYNVKVIAEPHAIKGEAQERVFELPEIFAPSTIEVEDQFEKAGLERRRIGDIVGLPVFINGFGNLFVRTPPADGDVERGCSLTIRQRYDSRNSVAGPIADGLVELMLSRNVEQFAEGYEIRCEIVREASRRRDDRPWWLRVIHWFRGARCHKCAHFDTKTAFEWRDRVTHTFAGISGGSDGVLNERMNHDIVKISAEQHDVADIPAGEFGWCAKKHIGLSGILPACRLYKKRRTVAGRKRPK